jgi:hypothetical protein
MLQLKPGVLIVFKITYDMETVTKIIKVKSSSVEWIADGVGVVKTESYNKKGKLTSLFIIVWSDKIIVS